MISETLDTLSELVACDTQNPPRTLSVDGRLMNTLKRCLTGDFRFQVSDYGEGCWTLLASRGDPALLYNVHLDTVPIGNGWTKSPLQMQRDSDRVYGRGVCDVKGAAACLITAARHTSCDVAILFSTDEEGAGSCCVRNFCESPASDRFAAFVVAEPTGCRAVTGHRGYLSVTGSFTGQSGHTSQSDLLPLSANHRAAQWIMEALDRVATFEKGQLAGQSACFNIGRIQGGVKNNMVADHCQVTWSARMPPGCSNQALLDCLLVDSPQYSTWETTFDGNALPMDAATRQITEQWARRCTLDLGQDVNFWTEATIFSELKKPTIVLGPGDIAQAHAADEWIAVDQLKQAVGIYQQLMQTQATETPVKDETVK